MSTVQTYIGPDLLPKLGKPPRRRVHTRSCGRAKGTKCVCVCKGARHKELLKQPKQAESSEPADEIDEARMSSLEEFLVKED